jgi:hypothetical protein
MNAYTPSRAPKPPPIIGKITIAHLVPRREQAQAPVATPQPAPRPEPPVVAPSAGPNKQARKRAAAAAVWGVLVERYPAAFTVPRPLAVGVHEQIVAAWPDIDRRALSDALRRWCGGPAYRAAFATATHRVGLDGAPAGEITDGGPSKMTRETTDE